MKKQNIFILFTTLCSAFVFVSCAEAPENVKEQAAILDNVSKNDSQDNDMENVLSYGERLEYGTLSQIRAQLDADLSSNHTQISIKNARIGTGESMPSYGYLYGGTALSNGIENTAACKIAELMFHSALESSFTFFSKNDPLYPEYPATDRPADWNNDGLVETMNSYGVDILRYLPDEADITKGFYIHGTGNSFGSAVGMVDQEVYWHAEFPTVVTYNVYLEPVDDAVSYTMYGGTAWSVNEAIEYFEDFYNEQLAEIDIVPFTYSVKRVYVKQLSDDTYGYLMELQRQDGDGNYYDCNNDSNSLRSDEERAAIADGQEFVLYDYSYVYAWEKEVVGYYNKECSISSLELISENETLLTLQGAVNILASTLANNKALSIPCAELCYATVCKGYPYYQTWNWNYQTDGYVFYEQLCKDNCEFELRPVWVFQTDYNTIEEQSDGEKYIVDAVTGEVVVIR